MRATAGAVAVVGLALACGVPPPEPVTVEIGVHRVSFIVPEGWQHYDHGREHRLETSAGDLVLTDLGPLVADGSRTGVLETGDLAELAMAALDDLDHGPRRDIESRGRLLLDGREAHRIFTWQRLTHDGRRRHVFIVNRGNLLVIRTEMGRDEVLGPAFDTVVRSLVFVDPELQLTR